MASRAIWKGVLTIRLVTIPIKVYAATEESAKIAFNQLHEACQTRIQQRKWCPSCAREITSAEIVKGFECSPGQFVILQPEELDAVQPESTRVIDLVQFADAGALDPTFVDRTYYLAPDGRDDAYAVLLTALVGQVGLGKLALYGREYLVAVRSQPQGLVLHTLHHAAEVRPIETVIEERPAPATTLRAEVRLARQLIDACRGPLNLADFTDQYHADVRRLIDAKIAGEEIVVAPLPPLPPVVRLFEALEESLALVKKVPAKATLKTTRRRAS